MVERIRFLCGFPKQFGDHPEVTPAPPGQGQRAGEGVGQAGSWGLYPTHFPLRGNPSRAGQLVELQEPPWAAEAGLAAHDWKEDAHPEMTLLCCSWKPLSQPCSERTWPHFKRIIIKSFWDVIQTNDSTCSACYMQCWVTGIKPVCYVPSVLSWTDFKKVKKAKSPDPFFFFHTWSFMRLSPTQHLNKPRGFRNITLIFFPLIYTETWHLNVNILLLHFSSNLSRGTHTSKGHGLVTTVRLKNAEIKVIWKVAERALDSYSSIHLGDC